MLALRKLTVPRGRKSPGRGGGDGVPFGVFPCNIKG
jgi:hypothetical protein